MRMHLWLLWIMSLAVCVTTWIVCPCATAADPPSAASSNQAREILEVAGVTGGLVVQIGCGDGWLAAGLHAGENFLVQTLDTDAATVQAARRNIQSLGLYGPVTVDRFDGKHLPYVDNLVNLLVCQETSGVGCQVSGEELQRVLAPGGVAMIQEGPLRPDTGNLKPQPDLRGWLAVRKPVPEEIDQWTHFLHDASNNAVAHDSVVGPPKGLQWFAGPLYCRSHEYDSSISALVSASGRIFYILDDGPIGVVDKRLPQQWSLYARDAFNGVLLWKIPLPDWGWPEWKGDDLAAADWTTRVSERLRSPVNLPRRLVADGERIYITLGYQAAVSILDAKTGSVIQTCAGTENTDEILYSDGVLLAAVRKDRPGMGRAAKGNKPAVGREAEPAAGTDCLLALDAATGQLLWETPPDAISQQCVAIDDGRVFLHTLDQLVCLNLRTGEEHWRASSQSIYGPLFNTSEAMVAVDGKVFFSGQNLEAYSAETGELLWSTQALKGPGRYSPPDLFVASGCVWAGHVSEKVMEGLDPLTGEVKQREDLRKLVNPWHHFRCYRSKATDRYLIWSKQGAEFIDLQGDDNMRHDWFRGPCRYGLMPCNGMLYLGPHQCSCFGGVMLNGFNAVTPRSAAEAAASAQPTRLQKGPAFGSPANLRPQISVLKSQISDLRSQISDLKSANFNLKSSDWPMFRASLARSGSVNTAVPLALSPTWQTELQGKLTQPVAAGGRLYVCEMDADRIVCLDSKDGQVLWSVTVGGRVDSPPTIHDGLAIFGAADGWVYCLRASDGVLVWRYRVAPAERRVVSMERVESVWPVHGAVLVQNGVAYAAAGRSSFLDGGIFLCALDPASGKLLHEAQLEGPVPDVAVDHGGARSMPGARVDVLVGDGENVYLRQVMFDANLNQQGSWGSKQLGSGTPNPHLVATSDLLDDAAFNRTCWRYDVGESLGQGGAQMLVFDGKTTYSAQVYSKHVGRSEVYFPGEESVRLTAEPSQRTRSRRGRRGSANDGAGWSMTVPIFVRAMVLAGDTLLVAGLPDRVDSKDPLASLEGRAGGLLWAVSARDGRRLAEYNLEAPPVFDGLIAADGRLYLSLADSRVICLGGE